MSSNFLDDFGLKCFLSFHSKAGATEANHSHSRQSEMSVEEVAMGFIRVANEAMCRPIRALTQVC